MVSFGDGPAKGVRLACRRAPFFLRVCRSRRTGIWDACDQIADCPAADEEVHVYALEEPPTSAFVCTRKAGGGPQQIGRYRVAMERPSDDVVRDNAAWASWCRDSARVLPEWMSRNGSGGMGSST